MVGSVAAVFATVLGRILMYPQPLHVGYLISICNLTVISCYANIRYSITCLGSIYPTRWIPMSSSSLKIKGKIKQNKYLSPVTAPKTWHNLKVFDLISSLRVPNYNISRWVWGRSTAKRFNLFILFYLKFENKT